MNKIRQHLPSFVDGEPLTASFETTEQLLEIDWIKLWSEDSRLHDPYFNVGDFFRFSVSPVGYLIAEFDKGQKWWVVGEIDQPNKVSLPQWDPRKASDLRAQLLAEKEKIQHEVEEMTSTNKPAGG